MALSQRQINHKHPLQAESTSSSSSAHLATTAAEEKASLLAARLPRTLPKKSHLRTKCLLVTIVILVSMQLLGLLILSDTFPALPSFWRSPWEAILIPLLPLARTGGHFRFCVYQRKWLYWPLTRARRLWLMLGRNNRDDAVFYIDIETGTAKSYSNNDLPPIPKNHLRYVVISDTHLLHDDVHLVPGHVLIHCGDVLVQNFGYSNNKESSKRFLSNFDDWLGKQQLLFGFESVSVTGGNHDGILQVLDDNHHEEIFRHGSFIHNKQMTVGSGNKTQQRIYLSASSRGSDGATNRAFQYSTDQAAHDIWSKVPMDVDILVTHGPPFGILDGPNDGPNAGCPILLQYVTQQIKPRVHVFGHWHDAGAVMEKHNNIVFVNAASVDYDYAMTRKPIVFDLG